MLHIKKLLFSLWIQCVFVNRFRIVIGVIYAHTRRHGSVDIKGIFQAFGGSATGSITFTVLSWECRWPQFKWVWLRGGLGGGGGGAIQTMYCSECGRKWKDVFSTIEVEPADKTNHVGTFCCVKILLRGWKRREAATRTLRRIFTTYSQRDVVSVPKCCSVSNGAIKENLTRALL